MRRTSMRLQMTAAFALATGLLVAMACGGLIGYAFHAAEANAKALLKSTVRKVADDMTDPDRRIRMSDLAEEERETLQPDNMALVLMDTHGKVLQRSESDAPAVDRPTSEWRTTSALVTPYRVVVGIRWRQTASTLRYQADLLIGLGLFLTAFATFFAWLLVGRTLSPIGALARQAGSQSSHRLDLCLSPPSRDAEILELVSTLNGLLTRLAETVASKARFHAAASHELRTPLQVLSGHLELALNRERTNEEYRKFICDANTYALRLNSLVRDLMTLHQLDGGRLPAVESVDVGDICERTVHEFAGLLSARALEVRQDLPENATITAPSTHAEMMVRNLMENAAKYAVEGSVVNVGLSPTPEGLLLTVRNECRQLEPDVVCRLFEPFYRAAPDRRHMAGGAGLGLAICQAVAEANGWRIGVSCENSLFDVHVTFGPTPTDPPIRRRA